METLNLKTTLKRLTEARYEIDFLYANKELQHLPSYGLMEFRITRGNENLRGRVVVVRTIARYIEIFGPDILTEMTNRVNTFFERQLYEVGIIEE